MEAIVVMGVAGVGKTTIGRALAAALGACFLEGDSLHSPSNVNKMSLGEPLQDADRWPWLAAIGEELDRLAADNPAVVATCSALKRSYRDVLRKGREVRFVHLTGSEELIRHRLIERQGHFMPPSLLDSQLATLEPLDDSELALTVDIADPPQIIVELIVSAFGSR